MKLFGVTLVAVGAVLAWSSQAAAQSMDQQGKVEYTVTVKGDQPVRGAADDYYMTFDQPVGLPEVTLPAGTYLFHPVDSSVVQVLSSDRREVYASFFTTPVWRTDATKPGKAEFERVKSDAPLRLVQWYEPYRLKGFEPYYPGGLPQSAGN